jgi:hypothetical protein
MKTYSYWRSRNNENLEKRTIGLRPMLESPNSHVYHASIL